MSIYLNAHYFSLKRFVFADLGCEQLDTIRADRAASKGEVEKAVGVAIVLQLFNLDAEALQLDSMELQVGLDTWSQFLPELLEGVLLGQGAFDGPLLCDNPNGDVLYFVPVLHDEAVAEVGRVLLVLPHEFLELAVPEAAEHVVDIVDAHIYSDDAGPESTVADAGGRLQILLEMLL